MDLQDELKQIIQGEVFSDEASLDRASHDASLFTVRPSVVVAPRDRADIEKLVSFVQGHTDQKLSLTVRSGGTDMGGGPLSESVVVDFVPHLNQIITIDGHQAVTQPGVFYRDFEKATLAQGLLMPAFPASREICTIGGMVANNSGGEKSLEYGKTEKYVESLRVVLSDGREHELKKLNKEQLDFKMAQNDYEGEVYRKVFGLVENNFDAIQKAKPRVSKNSAGYMLWNVWDRKTFDLAQLFVGSQGTLGIITEVTYRLIKPKPFSSLVVVFLDFADIIPEVVKRVGEYKPESSEMYDDKTVKVALRFLPEFTKFLGAKNIISLGWQFLPEFWLALTGGIPKFVILAEFTGDDQREVLHRAESARRSLKELSVSTRIAPTAEAAKKYWTIRRESFNLLRHHIRGKRTAPFIDDIIVPPDTLPKFLPRLELLLAPYHLTYSMVGHAGDGNLHIIPLVDPNDKTLAQTIREVSEKVYTLVLEFKGSITAEHNDGLIRTPFLKQMYGEQVYALFEEVKRIFDPSNIFNPGKKVGGSWEYILKHL